MFYGQPKIKKFLLFGLFFFFEGSLNTGLGKALLLSSSSSGQALSQAHSGSLRLLLCDFDSMT